MHYSSKKIPRGDWQRMARDMNPNWEITFNFGSTLKPETCWEKMEAFCKRLERKAFGSKWYKRSENRLLIVGFMEHPDTNIHFHALARMSLKLRRSVRKFGEDIWAELTPRGQLHAKPLKSVEKAISYFTKEADRQGRSVNTFLYVGRRGAFVRKAETRIKKPSVLKPTTRKSLSRRSTLRRL